MKASQPIDPEFIEADVMAILSIWSQGNCKEVSFAAPQPLCEILEQAGISGLRPCGGRGQCGKCAVTLCGQVSEPNEAEKKAGVRLACQAEILGDAQVFLPTAAELQQIQTESDTELSDFTPGEGIGAAVDIGTTTVVLRRYDLRTGQLLGQSAMINPQTGVAADVMGRIGAAMEGKLPLLRSQITDALALLYQQAGGGADKAVITGNTTMLYLLTGMDPSCLSHAPFEADTLFDTDASVLNIPTYLPPCMNAFVGADISCAVLASRMCRDKISLLCDIGTNGEIALWKDGVLFVTSTAAGPAFEGALISCGCSSIPGAIDKVWSENGQIHIHTIADREAVGICGSGLIDAVAVLLKEEIMDETGAMEDDMTLAPGVTLLQKDIRALQLAKAAIAAGIQTLLEGSGTTFGQIETFYLAGGFGSHLDLHSAAAIGLIPRELISKAKVIGNAALAGASRLLLEETSLSAVRTIARNSRHYNLGGNPIFNEYYMEQMLFPYDESI